MANLFNAADICLSSTNFLLSNVCIRVDKYSIIYVCLNIRAQFKLSQNKSAENRVGVVTGLKQLGTSKVDAMATLVKKVNED